MGVSVVAVGMGLGLKFFLSVSFHCGAWWGRLRISGWGGAGLFLFFSCYFSFLCNGAGSIFLLGPLLFSSVNSVLCFFFPFPLESFSFSYIFSLSSLLFLLCMYNLFFLSTLVYAFSIHFQSIVSPSVTAAT